MNIIVDSLVTNYRDEGQGRVMLMLHGWSSDLQSFDTLAQWAKSDYRVIRLDLPGFGGTQQLDRPWTLDDYTAFIKSFLAKIKVSDIAVLVGHSMGARIAIKAVALKQLKPKKLVLIGAHGIADKSMRNRLWALVAKTGKVATVALPKSARERLKTRLYKTAKVTDYVEASPVNRETFKRIVGEDLLGVAKNITQPTLLIYGSEDQTTPPAFGQQFQSVIKGSTLEIVQEVGHYVHQDDLKLVTDLLKGFLR